MASTGGMEVVDLAVCVVVALVTTGLVVAAIHGTWAESVWEVNSVVRQGKFTLDELRDRDWTEHSPPFSSLRYSMIMAVVGQYVIALCLGNVICLGRSHAHKVATLCATYLPHALPIIAILITLAHAWSVQTISKYSLAYELRTSAYLSIPAAGLFMAYAIFHAVRRYYHKPSPTFAPPPNSSLLEPMGTTVGETV